MRGRLPAVVAACAVFVVAACSSHDVPLATLSAGDDASTPMPPPRCVTIGDCPPNTYCDKASCSDPSGTCTLYPPECPNDEMPVCGSDGLTYFNTCIRQTYGVDCDVPDPCTGFTCGGPSNTPCPANSYCAQLGGAGPRCSPVAEGNCWVLPTQCPGPPDGGGGNFWDSCQQPGPRCVDTCDALRMGGPYGRSFMCP